MDDPRWVRAGTRIRAIPFRGAGEVERYRRKRYRRGPQRILHLRELRVLRRFIGLCRPPLPRVLDVPCGYGRLLGEIRSHALTAFGADLSPDQAGAAAKTAPSVSANVLAGLPFADGTFDLVLCARLMHHLFEPEDRRRTLAELARVSRRFVVVSYYDRALLWRVHRALLVALKLKRPRVSVVARREMHDQARQLGLLVRADRSPVPVLHAHRFLLLEKEG